MGTIAAHFRGSVGSFALDAAFTCPDAGIVGLFGPSGCGKTTILRCLAGETRLGQGYLSVGGEVWQDDGLFLPAGERPVRRVSGADGALLPLSVRANLKAALGGGAAGAGRRQDLDQVIACLGIEDLLERMPETLSGGERQRVAVGRAMLARPRVLLLDEPLSALDRDSKGELLAGVEALSRTMSASVLYVSHDFAELERLADHLLLMTRNGRVAASGTLGALLTDLSLPLARSLDSSCVIGVTVERYDSVYDLTECCVDSAVVFVPGNLGEHGCRRRIRVRAADVALARGAPQGLSSALNVLPARLLSFDHVDAHQTLVLVGLAGGAEDSRLLAVITRKSWDTLGFTPGDLVFAQVKSVALAEVR